MKPNLTSRLQDIAGVAQVAVDLDDAKGGIHVRLDPGADPEAVLEEMRTLLVAYGLRPRPEPEPEPELSAAAEASEPATAESSDLGVELEITPIQGGARVEVATHKVRSFRIVAPTPTGVAQGVADAWCQVLGRIPVEVTGVSVSEGVLEVQVSDGSLERSGRAPAGDGWEQALARAVGEAAGLIGDHTRPLAVNS